MPPEVSEVIWYGMSRVGSLSTTGQVVSSSLPEVPLSPAQYVPLLTPVMQKLRSIAVHL